MINYKNSELPWVGEVPENWELLRIGSLFKCRNVKVDDTSFPPLSVSRGGIVPQLTSVAKTDANDNRKQVLKGDFVINSRSDRKQSCGVSKLDGSVSLINIVLSPTTKLLDEDYVNFLLKNYGFAEEFYRWGHGIVADLWTTRWQEMSNIIIPVPPLDEQKKIVAKLSRKISDIDSLLENEQEEISLLSEYKQSIISEAVFGGLEGDCNFKGSGVVGLERIPQNWRVAPIKSCFDFSKGLPITKDDLISSGTPVISYGQLHAKYNASFYIAEGMIRYVDEKYESACPASRVNVGDFIMADTSEDIPGTCDFVLNDSENILFAGYHSIILKNKTDIDPKYLAFLFLSSRWRAQLWERVGGVKLFSLTQRILGIAKIVIPPKESQLRISQFLSAKVSTISALLLEKQKKIDLLEQERTSLIYEYVTGKKEA
jgi:type I restriction enzyme S subunit